MDQAGIAGYIHVPMRNGQLAHRISTLIPVRPLIIRSTLLPLHPSIFDISVSCLTVHIRNPAALHQPIQLFWTPPPQLIHMEHRADPFRSRYSGAAKSMYSVCGFQASLDDSVDHIRYLLPSQFALGLTTTSHRLFFCLARTSRLRLGDTCFESRCYF